MSNVGGWANLIGGVVQAGGSIYTTIKAGKDQKDLMNKQGEIMAMNNAYSAERMKQITIIVVVVMIAVVMVALLSKLNFSK